MNELLDSIIDKYLTSGDFNGLYIHHESPETLAAAIQLVEGGLAQVVDSNDYMNCHIRPWQSRRSLEEQVASVNNLPDAEYGLCLYPTPQAMSGFGLGDRFRDEPYCRWMAEGGGTLELAYFRFDVLEPYRNDPRFSFQFHDYGADAGVSDPVYLDESESEDDKTSISHIGFAYDLSEYDRGNPDSKIVRRVCAFLGDLAKLTPVHQQRWRTYEVPEQGKLKPHPIWWGQQMGHWPDGLGPFEKLFFELRTWNELHQRVFGDDLLRVTERPSDFGWILRPSQQEYDAFVHQLDKLLSDNIRHAGLDALGAAKRDGQDQVLGSLNRLDDVLRQRGVSEEARREVLKPLRDVRQARQRPAHAIGGNITDVTFIHKQASLLEQVTLSLENFRRFWQSHPLNSDWEEPEYAKIDSHYYKL
ncbi:hypothetical protein ACQP1G_37160 [Nocardia sp. CA-107356]|uniref:hypothetical protein n=1 Tax=Nocardia sp. CA-107356 TaxID=3239972 RepID=UPI003D8B0ABB